MADQQDAKLVVSGDESQQLDQLVEVQWDVQGDSALPLTGTLTVKEALAAGFAVFLLSGVKFDITSNTAGRTQVNFSYSGTRSRDSIKKLFKAGAELFFKRESSE